MICEFVALENMNGIQMKYIHIYRLMHKLKSVCTNRYEKSFEWNLTSNIE